MTLLGLAIFGHGNIANIGLLFLLPVMVAATRHGLRTGLVTALVSSLAYNFFFIPPTHTFTIEDPQNIITVLVLLGVALVASQLAAQVREQALQAEASAARSRALALYARQLTGISSRDVLAETACREIGRLLDCHAVMLVPDGEALAIEAASQERCSLETLDRAAAAWAREHARPTGRGTDTLPASEWLFHPLATTGGVRAVFGIAHTDARLPVSDAEIPLLERLLDQTSMALERIVLEEEKGGMSRLHERDELRRTLLSSVSHDLRTPLTTILGSLQAISPASDEQARQLAMARTEAERLNRFVANLLDMARIEAGALHQSIQPVDLAEAVASAVDDLGAALAGRKVDISVAPDLPFVMADPQLFHHCLINLIDNAAKYGDAAAPIAIAAAREGEAMVLSVTDQGPGIPPGEEARIFETFARIEGSDRKGGTGLGLAIVKGFAEAMGLTVEAANRPDERGARFAIRFGRDRLKECSEG